MRLLSEGKTPTIDEIAAAADVARRTIYTHFPTLDQLILDATMGAMAGSEVEGEFASDADVAGRVDAIVEPCTGMPMSGFHSAAARSL